MTSADLFKKFTLENVAQIASSSLKEQKAVRSALAAQFPTLSDHWEEILPKGREIILVRCHDQVHCVTIAGPQPEVLFFNHHGGLFLPHLKLIHKYPSILPQHQVDIGGCKHVVSGANVMCQGLTSSGGMIADNVEEGAPVAIYVEGKEHAVAVGFALMSSQAIRSKNKGPCVENVHHLGDGLWMNPILSSSHIGYKKAEGESAS